jgi:hypothetical protein
VLNGLSLKNHIRPTSDDPQIILDGDVFGNAQFTVESERGNIEQD